MSPRAVPQTRRRETITPTLASSVEPRGPTPVASGEPVPLRCLQCGTTWYSRVATLIVASGMSCARCGAPLSASGAED
jgi:hypothetical protein